MSQLVNWTHYRSKLQQRPELRKTFYFTFVTIYKLICNVTRACVPRREEYIGGYGSKWKDFESLERALKHPIITMEEHRKCGDYLNKLLFE